MLNTYIYHLLTPTCFGVCYTIFKKIIALFMCFMFDNTTYVTTLQKHIVLEQITHWSP